MPPYCSHSLCLISTHPCYSHYFYTPTITLTTTIVALSLCRSSAPTSAKTVVGARPAPVHPSALLIQVRGVEAPLGQSFGCCCGFSRKLAPPRKKPRSINNVSTRAIEKRGPPPPRTTTKEQAARAKEQASNQARNRPPKVKRRRRRRGAPVDGCFRHRRQSVGSGCAVCINTSRADISLIFLCAASGPPRREEEKDEAEEEEEEV